jgi:hypothetical protein
MSLWHYLINYLISPDCLKPEQNSKFIIQPLKIFFLAALDYAVFFLPDKEILGCIKVIDKTIYK